MALLLQGRRGGDPLRGRDRSELAVWATGLYPSFYTHSLVHWLVRALELCGARNCTVVHTPATRDEDPHRYVFHWEE